MILKKRANRLLRVLKELYPNAKISLNYSNNFELLVAVMLSAQTTDSQVNKVTKNLFSKYKQSLRSDDLRGANEREEIENFAKVNLKELENGIRSIGLYRTKAKNIKKTAKIILEKYKGQVPKTMNDLISLPGVGRKTANVILSQAFGTIEGIAVDTHVKRQAKELGLSKNSNPLKIEKDLMKLFAKKDWPKVTTLFIAHGRKKLPLPFDKI